MRTFVKKSIKVKLAAYMMLLVTSVIAVMTFVSLVAYQKYARDSLIVSTTEHLKALSYSISAALEFNDRELIKESLSQFHNSKVYVSAVVRKPDGTIFAQERFKDPAVSFKPNELVELKVPVLNEMKTEIGLLEAQITLTYLSQEFRRNVTRIVSFGIVVLFGGFFTTFFMIKKFLKPLLSLKTTIEQMSTRASVERVPVVSDDEIGDLANAFNQMSENLDKTMTSRDNLIREVEVRKKAQRELQEAHGQLVQSEKMASIGQLAAGVAHEINNPIGFVNSNMQTLTEYLKAYSELVRLLDILKQAVAAGNMDEARHVATAIDRFEKERNVSYMLKDVNDLIDESRVGLERVKKIVMDLRTFSRSDQGELELVNIEQIIQSVLNIVQNEIKYKCVLKEEYQSLPAIKCNPQRLSQVLINLIINASQAIEKKGTITLRTYQQDGYACIDVQDDGVGIAKDKLSKIFDPFYTTKPVGQGTGLGLSISYEILQKIGGSIKVESELGQGAKFTILVPLENPILQ